MAYLKVSIQTEQTEILLAFLQNLSFDSFEEKTGQLDAYILATNFNESVLAEMAQLQERFVFDYQVEQLPDKNWNVIWEANFQPLLIDSFCAIRADFHPPIPKVQHEIIINPKMAFGTGHHETTYMMLKAMNGYAWTGTKVLDYGCGTGVLAILAAYLGAENLLAIDIEAPAVENTQENLKRNGVEAVDVRLGTLAIVEEKDYDFILANINRNVILDSLPTLYQQLKKNGTLLVSGFIKKDANL
ncbi:MAG: 50S ribosomal protein L11 methyltransferase, partial [Bacteroidota bacterium]